MIVDAIVEILFEFMCRYLPFDTETNVAIICQLIGHETRPVRAPS